MSMLAIVDFVLAVLLAIGGNLVTEHLWPHVERRQRAVAMLFAAMMLTALFVKAGLSERTLLALRASQCPIPADVIELLPGFKESDRKLTKVVPQDLDLDGRLDLVLLTDASIDTALAGQVDGTHLDVLACRPSGDWVQLMHQQLRPIGPVYLEVCACRWDDPSASALPLAAAAGETSSIIVTSDSRGGSGRTLQLDVYEVAEATIRHILSKNPRDTVANVQDRRLVMTYLPSFADQAMGQHLRSYVFARSAADNSFREVDLTVGAAQSPPASASVPTDLAIRPAYSAPAFTDLTFCTPADFDARLERCRVSATVFPAETRRVYLSWHADHTGPNMSFGQIWWLNGQRQDQMSSPPNAPKRWTDTWRDNQYNYTFIDSCSRDPLAVCSEPLVGGRYQVELQMDDVRMAGGQFEIGR